MYTPLTDTDYLSELGSRRAPSALRALVPIMAIPGMISLGGGLPNPALFPFKSVKIEVEVPGDSTMREIVIDSNDAEAMSDAFQYSATYGIPSLTNQLKDLQTRTHISPYQSTDQNANSYLSNRENWNILITVGSQDGLAKTFEMLLNTSYEQPLDQSNQTIYRPCLLTELPTYSGAISIVRPMGAELIGVSTDQFGIIPESLNDILTNWDAQPIHQSVNQSSSHAVKLLKPKVLYLIPNGQNPSGTTMTLERKIEVYRICCQHDLLILEDDPYAYLTYGEQRVTPASIHQPADQTINQPFVRPTTRSLFSLDTQGRVLRFDSLSKILSSGLRIGFVTGPSTFVNRLMLSAQCSSLHASGISQVIAAKYLQLIGPNGWQAHVDRVSLFYAKRRDFLCDLLDLHLSKLIEYNRPSAGMFVWLKCLGIKDSKKLIEEKARKALVLLVPGQVFMPDDQCTNYVRASFSLASEQDMEIAVQRLAEILKTEATERGDVQLLN